MKDQFSPQSLIGIRNNESIIEGVNRQLSVILSPNPVVKLKYILGLTSKQNEITRLFFRLETFHGGLDKIREKYMGLVKIKLEDPENLDISKSEMIMYERLIMFADQMLEHSNQAIVKVQSRLAMEADQE